MSAPLPAPTPAAEPLTLEAGGSLVALDPAPGGRVTRLRLAGREWLAPGGWDETLLVGGAPAGDALVGGAPAATARAGDAGAVTRWDDPRLPYALERTLTVQPDGAVRAEYVLTSRAAAPLAVHWAARPRLPLLPGTRLDLPVAARVRVLAERGVALGGVGALHRWPVLRVGAGDATRFGPREVDFTFPALAPRRFGDGGRAAYGCALALDLPRPAGVPVRLGVEQAGARLELAVDPAAVPLGAVWIDADGAAAGGAATLAVGAAVGAPPGPDAGSPNAGAAAAAAAGDGAGPGVALAPGEVRRWALTWRGRAAPASA